MIKILGILLFIAAVGLLIGILIAPANKPPTSRFEVLFGATTQDEVELTVRLLGSYETEKWSGSGEFLKEFKETVRRELKTVDDADIPKKVKLLFQKELKALKDTGVNVDSIYQYVPDA